MEYLFSKLNECLDRGGHLYYNRICMHCEGNAPLEDLCSGIFYPIGPLCGELGKHVYMNRICICCRTPEKDLAFTYAPQFTPDG